jgi:hypothetical protein
MLLTFRIQQLGLQKIFQLLNSKEHPMIICEESIKNESRELSAFLGTLQGCNYVVYGSLVAFDYDGNADLFSINLIKKIYNKFNEETDGNLRVVTFRSAFEDINSKLRLTALGDGENHDDLSGLDITSNIEYEKRKQTFWNIIVKTFDLSTEKVYYYEDYFSSDVMWGFCYIFLKDGKGLVLHAGASD